MAPVLGAKLETQSRNQQFRAVFRRKRLDRLDPLFHLRLVESGRRRKNSSSPAGRIRGEYGEYGDTCIFPSLLPSSEKCKYACVTVYTQSKNPYRPRA